MDYRVERYLNKMFSDELQKTVEKRMFDLGLAWGYYAVIDMFREEFEKHDGNQIADNWLKQLSSDPFVGEYIKEIIAITEKEMSPSEKIMQEISKRHRLA